MRNREMFREIQRIRDLTARVAEASHEDLELQAHWAKYLCVLCSGLLENAITELYGDYASKKSNPEINGYVIRQLEKVQNPNSTRLLEVARSFKEDWARDIEAFMAMAGRREAIDTIITNRHHIVHGEDSNITIMKVKDCLHGIIQVLDHIEELLS